MCSDPHKWFRLTSSKKKKQQPVQSAADLCKAWWNGEFICICVHVCTRDLVQTALLELTLQLCVLVLLGGGGVISWYCLPLWLVEGTFLCGWWRVLRFRTGTGTGKTHMTQGALSPPFLSASTSVYFFSRLTQKHYHLLGALSCNRHLHGSQTESMNMRSTSVDQTEISGTDVRLMFIQYTVPQICSSSIQYR